MRDTRQQVLQMLSEGTITAAEAAELLAALNADTHEPLPPETAVTPTEPPPDMARYRRYWRIPFFLSLTFLIITALWLRTLYQRAEGAISLSFFCVWSLFLFTVILTSLALASRQSTWLHIRIREKNARPIRISLPLPLRLARWGLTIASGFVPENTRSQLDMASTFMETAASELQQPNAKPLMIQVDEEDGDSVLIYFG